jgi:L-ascorbate metabolism protein UlaG (beta-lactamase superfamily)
MAAALLCLRVEAQLSFTTVELTNREARLRFNVPAGSFARVDVSTNLENWFGFLTSGGGAITHTDVFAPFTSFRFYRAQTVTNTGTFAGDHFPTDTGDVILRHVNHAGFVMSWNGKTIYNDPVNGSFTPFSKADLILVGHEHGDHFNATILANVKATNGVIVTSQTVYNSLSTTLRASTIVLANGQSTTVAGIDILAVPAYNGNHPVGVGNGYVLTIGGKKFYISGDTSSTPEMRALTGIDVAFLAMNSFTMTASEAATAAQAFRPKVVYPYHYSGSLGNPGTFKSLVGTNMEVRLRAFE